MGATIENYIRGTESDDYLVSNEEGDVIDARGGNDTLIGNGGNDYLDGGLGNDTLRGGSGNDVLDGGLYNDTADYFGTNHGVIANLVFGTAKTLGAGPEDTDTLRSIENLIGTQYDDFFQGSELHNKLEGMGGNDVLFGWEGDDLLLGGFGTDSVFGGTGRDRLSGGFDYDKLFGNEDIDTADYTYAYQGMVVDLAAGTSHTRDASYYVDSDDLYDIENATGSYYDDLLIGNAGDNVLEGLSGNDTMQGGAGRDVLRGGDGSDWVDYHTSAFAVGVDLSMGFGTLGDASWDTYVDMENIFGSENAMGDVLTGNDNANMIVGNGGNDVIRGKGGADLLRGGSGLDFIDGGDGDDTVNGGDEGDSLDGGSGFDTLDFTPSFGGIDPVGPGVSVNLAGGAAAGLGNDGETLKNFEAVIGTVFNDIIRGNEGHNVLSGGFNNDRLFGNGGADLLTGDDGNDRLNGGSGNDDLIGGRGADSMTGGLGFDQFIFRGLVETGTSALSCDTIEDFAKGQDRIDLSGIDANTTIFSFGNQAFTFIDDDAFTGVAGQLRSFVSGNTTTIQGDTDGNLRPNFQIVLDTAVNLSALDFFL